MRLIQFQREYIAQEDIDKLPGRLRGIYVLYETVANDSKRPFRNVVYVGMSTLGMKGRLRNHRKETKANGDKGKGGQWDCCSVFVVWPNVRDDEIRELEGILRHIFRRDDDAKKLNVQLAYSRLLNTPEVPISEANRKQQELVEDETAAEFVAEAPAKRARKSPARKRA